jgi:uncharacterized cupin superfamily protein
MNLLHPRWDGEVTFADGSTARAVQLARHAGAQRLGATLYELDTGAAASPLHFHHRNEELLFVMAGEPTLRTAADERVLCPGEVVAFLPGREGVHQVVNRTDEPARILVCSSNDLPEIAEQTETGVIVLLTDAGACTVERSATTVLSGPAERGSGEQPS